jgi:hypothetical protein
MKSNGVLSQECIGGQCLPTTDLGRGQAARGAPILLYNVKSDFPIIFPLFIFEKTKQHFTFVNFFSSSGYITHQ